MILQPPERAPASDPGSQSRSGATSPDAPSGSADDAPGASEEREPSSVAAAPRGSRFKRAAGKLLDKTRSKRESGNSIAQVAAKMIVEDDDDDEPRPALFAVQAAAKQKFTKPK